ncbi:MAG TPA: RNA 2',3'-cyclic phosphodiesterase [Nitrospiria bacterium]|nr:RNA 2',3'-cyclic phosphodiesterase [Nitrospiria bacterium]
MMYATPTKNSDTIRAFIAVPLSPETIERLRAPVEELRALCRKAGIEAAWSRPEGWHLTLKFLGQVAPDQMQPFLDRLPACAGQYDVLTVNFGGFGAFPTPRRPRVLWIGVEPDGGAASLVALARTVDEMTASLGYPSEERPFSPHLTVARIRTPPRSVHALTGWLEQRRADRLAAMLVERIALMRSDVRPGGSVYTPVAEFMLGKSDA